MNDRRLIRRLAPVAPALVLVLCLAACGQKGPLYLPDGDMPQKVERTPADASAGNTPDRSNEPRKKIH
ncbi:MAG: Prokaryotic lipoprotein-attachment site [Pseudomonadota bacterium]|jgi:predicted small lipoprotein YifL